MKFEDKMDKTFEVICEAMSSLAELDDEDFSSTLSAFRAIVFMATTDGWSADTLHEHVDDEIASNSPVAKSFIHPAPASIN